MLMILKFLKGHNTFKILLFILIKFDSYIT